MIPKKSNTFSNLLKSKVFLVVMSLLASLMLWFYVTTVEGEEIELTFNGIDVVFSGEENLRNTKGFVITDVSSNSVNVRLRGPRSVLSALDATKLSAVIDVSTATRIGTVEKTFVVSYPTNVDSSGISIVTRTPNTISYYIDREITKTVELRGQFGGSVAEGYIREEFVFDPLNVRISGPAAELDKVSYAVVAVDKEDLDKTISFDSTFKLVDSDGNTIDSPTIEFEIDSVNVTIPIKATKKVPLTVDIISGGGATDKNVTIACAPATITLSGDPDILEGVNSISVGTIDLSTFDPVITQKYPILIPNDTECITGETEVEVTVEVKGLTTAKKTITNIDYKNLPEGMKAEIVSKSLEVVIRGNEDSVKAVASNNIRAVADLAEITTTGTIAVSVKVSIDGFTDVGAVGEYKVYITIER